VFVLALPLALITTNIRAALSEHRVYDYSVQRYGAEAISGIPEGELLRANRALIAYFQDDDPGPLRIEVRDRAGRAVPLFNARETAHLADVRELVRSLFTAQVIAVAVVLSLAVVMLAWWPLRAAAAAALYGALFTVGLVGLVGLMALLGGFNSAWTQFHFLAFTNDLWRLDPASDHLIQMFPEPFWQDASLLVGAATVVEALLVAGTSAIYLFTTRAEIAAKAPVTPRPTLPRPPRPRPWPSYRGPSAR